MKARYTVPLNIRLSPEQRDRIEALMIAEQRGKHSDMIRILINDGLDIREARAQALARIKHAMEQ